MVWAYAKNGSKAEELFAAIAGEHQRILRDGKALDFANICEAFATLGHKADNLFSAIAGDHRRIGREGNAHALSSIVWAFATLEHSADELFTTIGGESGRISRDGKSSEIATTLWAFASAGQLGTDNEKALVKIWQRACGEQMVFSNESLRQIALFHSVSETEGGLNLDPCPTGLFSRMKAAASAQDEDAVQEDADMGESDSNNNDSKKEDENMKEDGKGKEKEKEKEKENGPPKEAGPDDGEDIGNGWVRYVDPDNEVPYYFNAETNVTTWDIPSEGFL